MKGWFDAFRHDGGPTLYDRANRTAVTGDVPTIVICVIFITLFAAFVIIFPGIRRERFATFTSVTISLFVGAVILVSGYGSEWHTAEEKITSAYRAFSTEKIVASLGVHIGFNHVNVTLHTTMSANASDRIDYNERFSWKKPDEMALAYELALHKGLPYPILTVAEYLAWDEEGFSWGRTYRSAGYYSCISLWSAFASWLLMNILLVVVPRYGAYMAMLTGALMMCTNVIYYMLVPSRPLLIRFEDTVVTMRFGWCYWLVLFAGVLVTIFGAVVSLIEMAFPHKFSTTLELDYDTPYDRHIIIEESHTSKWRKSKFEDGGAVTFGSRILRRLSKRQSNHVDHNPAHGGKYGYDNPSMEHDPPKSPWRYPHRTFSNAPQRPTSRSESRKSTKSVNFREFSYGSTLHPSDAANMAPSSTASSEVETIPDVHALNEPPIIKTTEPDWDSCSVASSSDCEGDDQVERVQDVVNPVAINFALRTAASRQNSSDSRFSRASGSLRTPRSNAAADDDDWDVPEMPVVSAIKSALHKAASSPMFHSSSASSAAGSGSSTPMRRISNEEADVIELDRTGGSVQHSALATVSARITAAIEADRSARPSGDGDVRVDIW